MFSLFGPRCPLSAFDKAWVEWRMRWIAERVGISQLLNAHVVLPTGDFFPEPLSESSEIAEKWLNRLCEYMGIDPAAVRLEIVDDEQLDDAVGQYEIGSRSTIRIVQSQLAAPIQLLATMTHELAHEILFKGGHVTGETWGHEEITDLVPVFLGTGIFVANATVHSSSYTSESMHYFSISRQGYLSSMVLGHALAVFAYLRGEDRPEWTRYLRPDAAVVLRRSLKYFQKSGDCLLKRDMPQGSRRPPSSGEVERQLKNPSPTDRIGAIWDIGEYELLTDELFFALIGCLSDREAEVAVQAASTISLFEPSGSEWIPALMLAAKHKSSRVRCAACQTMGVLGVKQPESVAADMVSLLITSLADPTSEVGCAAAEALERFGPVAIAAEAKLLDWIEITLLRDSRRLNCLISALNAISPAPADRLKERYPGPDQELRREVLAILRGL